MKSQKGFSLIELLIVVVIIGIIAAVAIPNLLAARRASNEGSAISSLRAYHGAQMAYKATIGSGNYAGDVGATWNPTAFTDLAAFKLLDSTLGSGTKSGFSFAGAITHPLGGYTNATFCGTAVPVNEGGITATGTRYLGIATDGVLVSMPVDGSGYGCAINNGAEFAAGTPLSN